MNILAFDTSTAQGGVAVLENDKTLARLTWRRQGSHAEFLTPAMQKCLGEAGLRIEQIDLLALGQGPGSFTGTRVSVNAARSLGFALGKKIFVCSTNEILAAALLATGAGGRPMPLPAHEGRVLTLVDAQKNLVYAATFAIADGVCRPTSPIELLPLAKVVERMTSPHICVGDASRTFVDSIAAGLLDKDDLSRESEFPDPAVLGRIAFRAVTASSPTLVWNEVHALYLRASGAEEKLAKSE